VVKLWFFNALLWPVATGALGTDDPGEPDDPDEPDDAGELSVAERFEFEVSGGGLLLHATSINGRISKYDRRKLSMIGCFNVLYIGETPAKTM
jgi:hypothetical protein